MVTVGLHVPLEAKPGKEAEVEAFLKSGQALVENEPATIAWFAVRVGPTSFAIVDFFPDDDGRQAHLNGKVAEALMAMAPDLFAVPARSTRSTSSRPSSRPEGAPATPARTRRSGLPAHGATGGRRRAGGRWWR